MLGKAYHVNLRFDEAITTYNELVINKAYKQYRSVDILQNEIRACEASIVEFKKKKRLKVESPGNGINTEFTQHSPFLIEDQVIFIYTYKEKTTFLNEKNTDGEYDENIFFILIDNENDKEPDPYSKPLNSKDNEANCWVSRDGNIMFVYRDGDILRSFREAGIWSKPEKFKEVNSKYDETHASMNDDHTIVFFSSNRPGGMGGKDIYYISKTGEDNWSDPILLNGSINTKFDEEALICIKTERYISVLKDIILLADMIFLVQRGFPKQALKLPKTSEYRLILSKMTFFIIFQVIRKERFLCRKGLKVKVEAIFL